MEATLVQEGIARESISAVHLQPHSQQLETRGDKHGASPLPMFSKHTVSAPNIVFSAWRKISAY
jgi:hypothetical protein